MPFPLAQAVDETSLATFLLVTIAYFALLWLSVSFTRSEFRLIGAGLLTAVAAMAYGCLVFPGGPLLAPQLMKLGFVLVLGGLVLRTLESRETPPSEAGHE